jgi:hypothetical protein
MKFDTIIFIHIRKTAGTALRKVLLEPNFSKQDTYDVCGLKKLIRDQTSKLLLQGHTSYGLHVLLRNVKNPCYLTLIRDPVERAISYYYFLRNHPERIQEPEIYNSVMTSSLGDFVKKNQEMQNEQSRALAGFVIDRTLRHFDINNKLVGSYVLRKAKRNLQKQNVLFGLTEKFDESVNYFANKLGLKGRREDKKVFNKTRERPSINEIDNQDLQMVRRYNSIDIALYEFAKNLFPGDKL